MAYQPPPSNTHFPGQAPLQNPNHQHGHHTTSATSATFIKAEQRPQAPLARFPNYAASQQHLQPQPFPATPPAATYSPRPGNQLHSAPPNVALQYGAVPAAPGPYYNLPHQSNMYPSPHPQYQAPPPPRPQPRSETQSSLSSKSPYPQIQIRPPSITQVQELAINVENHKATATKAGSPRQQHMRSTTSKQTKPAKVRTKCENQSIDYQVLLLSLADEYLDAAHSQGTILAGSRQEADIEQYHKLIATGLCCIEAVLKNWRLQPRTEALLRLRYARVLFEETNNDLEAETTLSKGNRMVDLKYSMQQLLCRILYKSNPKAAMKTIEGIIRGVEAIGDKAIVVVSSIIEALVHLQHSSSGDSIEQAQRAIAMARSHQLHKSVGDAPHINTMIQMADICCSVLEYDIPQAAQKLQILQKNMDQNINSPLWQDDGSFSVPLSQEATIQSTGESGDIFQLENGNRVLMLTWLPEVDIYALCYFLSSVTLSAKNSQDGHKAEKYLQEGLRMIRGSLEAPQEVSESFMFATARFQWRRSLYCHMLLQQLFLACARTDWPLARRTLKEVQKISAELGDSLHESIQCLIQYAAGIIAQATGDLKRALAIFQQPIFFLSQSVNKQSRNDPRRDIAILAGLNCVLIHRDPTLPSYPAAANALSSLETFCQNNPNRYIQAAYALISATIQTESTVQTKRNLHQSLQVATAICNSQVTCLALTFMSWKYFRGVVGEQAEKSAMAAKAMARKTDDKLWISVTDELLAETLDRQGKANEAIALRQRADSDLAILPPVLTKTERSTSSQNGVPAEMRMKAVKI
ncbi:hypothetical protein PRK78_007031 [Emydomyces testavorans]|uniref:Cohesin loading factor n=1 Tax=Emydomyces testavorans TaxID=2070801 RepID=A0AAF0IM99_9EURO|nr:hypothetical protein PRK78_007031 [Emydomyces testavorans]